MLENVFEVFTVTFSIGVLTVFVGCIPLHKKLNPIFLLFASIVSMCVLQSDTLVIAVPQGIVAEFGKNEDYHKAIKILPIAGCLLMNIIDNLESVPYIGRVFEKCHEPKYGNPYGQTQLRTSVIFKSIILSTATLGLVIHATTDGISLGTSFVSMAGIQPKFYYKLLGHKLPMVINLVTILIKENYSYSIIPFHLALFSLVTSIASFASYLAFSMESIDPLVVKGLLLFSQGILFYFFMNMLLDICLEKIVGTESKRGGQFSEFAIKEEKAEMEDKVSFKTSLQRDKLFISLCGITIATTLNIVLNR